MKSINLGKLSTTTEIVEARGQILDLEARLAEIVAIANRAERRGDELRDQERELIDARNEAKAEALARPGPQHAKALAEIEQRLADVGELLGELDAEVAPHRRAAEMVEADLADARRSAQEAEEEVLDAWHAEAGEKALAALSDAVSALYAVERVRHPRASWSPPGWRDWIARSAPSLDAVAAAAEGRVATLRTGFDAPRE